MRIVIETNDDTADLTRARDCIDALLRPVSRQRNAPNLEAGLDALSLSSRPANALAAAGISTVGELCAHTHGELMRLQGFGPTSLKEVAAVLAAHGLGLTAEPAD